MTSLCVGLGNPGQSYENNRHNVGFKFIEYVVNKLTDSQTYELKLDQKFDAKILKLKIGDTNYLFAEPQTYMNASGAAIQKMLTYFKIRIEALTVVHDDLDIKLGDYKIQMGSGPKQHNGISSIETSLATKDFKRIRIGIENRSSDIKISGEDYVLSNFSTQEFSILMEDVFPKIDHTLSFLS